MTTVSPLLDGIERPILFIFDDAIASQTNVRKIFRTPRKDPRNPVLRPDRPWEGHRIQPWGSLFPWEGKWRQLYNSLDAKGRSGIHVLETEDGRNWRRPALGLHPASAGNAKTNTLIPAGDDGQRWLLPSLIRHPNPPDPSWNHLLYMWGWGKTQGLVGHKSRDGLQFERFSESPILSWGFFGPGRTNDVVMACWDTQHSRFVMYATVLLPQVLEARTPWDNVPNMKRCMARLESADGIAWEGPELVLAPDRHEPEWQQYYGMTVSEYEGLWVGFPLYYHVREQFMQPHIVFSRDGRFWERPTRQPFLPCGDSPDRWDYGNVLLSWDFLRLGDELIFVYGGSTGREHTVRMGMALGVASLRRDGFVALAPGGAESLDAKLLTVPLARAPGRVLLLNTEPDFAGEAWLSAEIQDANGRIIEGYTFDACGHTEADGVSCAVHWGAKGRLPDGPGPLRLHIHLHQQRLYSIRFGD
jgi:hypothetical protein